MSHFISKSNFYLSDLSKFDCRVRDRKIAEERLR